MSGGFMSGGFMSQGFVTRRAGAGMLVRASPFHWSYHQSGFVLG